MARKKVDTSKLIRDPHLRSVAYCKRKKFLLLKAIELARMCKVKVFMVIQDPSKKKLVKFSSSDDFTVTAATSAVRENKFYDFEKYTCDDYQTLLDKDFRTTRYKKGIDSNEDSDEEESKDPEYFNSKK